MAQLIQSLLVKTGAAEKLVAKAAKSAKRAVALLEKAALILGIEIRVTFYERGGKLICDAVADGRDSKVLSSAVSVEKFRKDLKDGI